MRSIILANDAMGHPLAAISPSDHVNAVSLTAGVPKQVTAPAEARLVIFSATAPFWARIGAEAALPAGDVLDGTAPEYSPYARSLGSGTLIGLVAAGACQVSLSFYR